MQLKAKIEMHQEIMERQQQEVAMQLKAHMERQEVAMQQQQEAAMQQQQEDAMQKKQQEVAMQQALACANAAACRAVQAADASEAGAARSEAAAQRAEQAHAATAALHAAYESSARSSRASIQKLEELAASAEVARILAGDLSERAKAVFSRLACAGPAASPGPSHCVELQGLLRRESDSGSGSSEEEDIAVLYTLGEEFVNRSALDKDVEGFNELFASSGPPPALQSKLTKAWRSRSPGPCQKRRVVPEPVRR
jgi:hypothetical protein